MSDPIAALARVAQREASFVYRGDQSGTHQLEQKLWRVAGIRPGAGDWYTESGHGMGETLQMADHKRAYTITDRATYLALRHQHQLDRIVEVDTRTYRAQPR